MTYDEEVRAAETEVLKGQIRGYDCEVVNIDGKFLLYVNGYFEGEIFEETCPEDYIDQIEQILP